MGMDVYGRAPSSDEGGYFRSNIWGWPSIIEAIASVGVLPEELVDKMCYNDGAGPDAEQAVALADALEAKYGEMRGDAVFIADDSQFSRTGTAQMGRELLTVLPMAEGETPDFSADVESILAFARFARASGGFEVC